MHASSLLLFYPSLSSVHLLFICSGVLVQYILNHLCPPSTPKTSVTNSRIFCARSSSACCLQQLLLSNIISGPSASRRNRFDQSVRSVEENFQTWPTCEARNDAHKHLPFSHKPAPAPTGYRWSSCLNQWIVTERDYSKTEFILGWKVRGLNFNENKKSGWLQWIVHCKLTGDSSPPGLCNGGSQSCQENCHHSPSLQP